jgi:hypothetical protein
LVRVENTKPIKQKVTGHNRGIIAHFHSKDGWWIVIEHRVNIFTDGKKETTTTNVLCPKCTKKHNEGLANIINNTIF